VAKSPVLAKAILEYLEVGQYLIGLFWQKDIVGQNLIFLIWQKVIFA
jgi:hypothetical protein